MKIYFYAAVSLLLAACEPINFEPVAFVPASGANMALFAELPARKGWPVYILNRRAEGRARHRLKRVEMSFAGTDGIDMQSECVRSHGGAIIAAQRTTFADGDVGLLVTCTK